MKEAREDRDRFAPGAASRLTGLSAHCLRAWERRYGAVSPARTPGGARRYSQDDLRRLRLLRSLVESGHPISQVAGWSDQALQERLDALEAPERRDLDLPIERALGLVRAFDVEALEQLLARQLAVRGLQAFSRELAAPLLVRVGDEWEAGRLGPAAEHATSASLRSLLGDELRRQSPHAPGPRVLFSTPAGEAHELGSLVAAASALGLGARAVFLGPDLPVGELVAAASRLAARALALGIVCLDPGEARRQLTGLRRELPAEIALLIGGPGAATLSDLPGITFVSRLEELEDHVRIH